MADDQARAEDRLPQFAAEHDGPATDKPRTTWKKFDGVRLGFSPTASCPFVVTLDGPIAGLSREGAEQLRDYLNEVLA